LPALIAFFMLIIEIVARNRYLKILLKRRTKMQLFRFANPVYLYLLLLLPVMILLYIINEIRKRKALKRLGDINLVSRLIPEMSGIKPATRFISPRRFSCFPFLISLIKIHSIITGSKKQQVTNKPDLQI